MGQQTRADLTDRIVAAVGEVVGDAERPVALHAPSFSGRALDNLRDCIETGWVSSNGAYVNEFEQTTAAYTGAAHAVAVVNGTAALHVALRLVGVGRDDEVVMPSLTFVATANAATYQGAVPHFVDVEPTTMGLDPAKLDARLETIGDRREGGLYNTQTNRRIAAIVPVHAFGHPADLDSLLAVADKHGVPIVEDAAESLGSTYKSRHTGTFGRLGILSYNGNKILTTGGGGMILTNDPALADEARHLTTTAKAPHPYEYVHDRAGYNYRMPNVNAAIGCAEMKQLDTAVAAKRRLHARYTEAFAQLDDIDVFTGPHHAESNCWLNALVLAPGCAELRNEAIESLNEAQLQARPIWRPMHTLAMYRECPADDLSATTDLAARVINVPSSAHLVK